MASVSLLAPRAWSPGMWRSVTCMASHHRVEGSPDSEVASVRLTGWSLVQLGLL